ncbi:MAG TPA: sugar ABC transporter substrate-binding protein [Limnochordia bacterium]
MIVSTRLGRVFAVLLALVGLGAPGHAQVVLRWATGQGGAYFEFAQALAARYEEETGVKIDVQFANYDELREKVIIQHAIGDPIDIFDMHSAYLIELTEAGILMDLRPYLEMSSVIDLDEYIPATVEGNNWNGKQVGLPIATFFDVLYYNADHFADTGLAEPPARWTWDDFERDLQTLTRIGPDGSIERAGLQHHPWWATTMQFIYQAGGDFFDSANRRAVLDEAPVVEAVSFLKELRDRQLMVDDGFRQGRVATLVAGSWDLRSLSELGIPFGVANLVYRGTGTRASNLPFHMSSISHHPDAAWAFIEYLFSPEVQAELHAAMGWMPAWIPAAQQFVNQPAPLPLHRERLLELLVSGGHIPPRHPLFARIEPSVNQTFDRIFRGELAVESGLAELNRQINAIIGASES